MIILSFTFIPLSQSAKCVSLLQLSPAKIGLALSSCINMLGYLQGIVKQSTEVVAHLTSVERIMEYADLEEEKSIITGLVNKK